MKLQKRGIIVHPEELTATWLEWMTDAGLNTLGLHPVGGPNAHESLQRSIDLHATPHFKKLLALAASMGITVEYEAHVMSWLLPRHLYSVHPEWFRMDKNGIRQADFNLCASNIEALDYIAHRTALLASLLYTGSSRYYYWLDDVTGYKCHCSACQHLSASDQQLKIINAMLNGLKTFDHQSKLCHIAYHDTMEVPTIIKPLEGVFLEYAPIKRNPHCPICDPNCPENAAENRTLCDLLDFFGTQDARVLEYWMDNSMYSNWTKPPKAFQLDEAVMKQDVTYYTSLGFKEITSFGCYLGLDYQVLHGNPPVRTYGDILCNIEPDT